MGQSIGPYGPIHLMRHIISFLLCCVLLCTGCKDDSEQSDDIFVGGQINNPETDYVILSKENEVIDTLYLDKNNQFGKDYKDLESGIYTFKHPPENQIMYIEPGDSIVIWLNTISFDQSLNFSGEGAEKSNFLLDMFLKNQENNDLILTYYKIDPEKFAEITDSIKNQRLQTLKELEQKNKFSEEFMNIANASINYEYYDLRERYQFLIEKYYKKVAQEIPEDFDNYRKEINFNDERVQDYYVYTNLIDDYLRSKSIEYCKGLDNPSKDCYNLNSFPNMARRMILIDSLTDIKPLKNEFIDRLAAQSITMAENETRIDSILSLLRRLDYSNIEEAENLAKMHETYFVGNSIKDVKAENTKGEIVNYGDVIKNPTITYAWSIYAPAHHRWQHQIIKKLKQKYPELDFLGVNIDLGEREEWLRTLETFGYDKENEYQIAKREADKETYQKYLNKVLFVDSNATIVRGDISFGSPDFEEEILEFLNK